MSQKSHARLIQGIGGVTDPVIQLIIQPHDNEAYEQVGLVDVQLTPNEARYLGYTLLGLSSEGDAQKGYITALRSMKEDEGEIMEMINEAMRLVQASRESAV